MLATLARHTVLAASLPWPLPETLDPEAVASGVRLARREGLGRAAFLVRIAALSRTWTAEQRAAFWIGAVAAEDTEHLCRHRLMDPAERPWVCVGGRDPLRELYYALINERYDGPVATGPCEATAALGAVVIAQRHHELNGTA